MMSGSSFIVLLAMLALAAVLVEAAGRPWESWADTALQNFQEDEEEGVTIPTFLHDYESPLDAEKINEYAASLEDHTLGDHIAEFCRDAKLVCNSNITIDDLNMDIFGDDFDDDDPLLEDTSKSNVDGQALQFDEKDFVKGKDIVLPESLHYLSHPSPSFLPQFLAEKMPLSSEKIQELLDTFHILYNSNMANMMFRTISRCESVKEKSSKEIEVVEEKEIKEKEINHKKKESKEKETEITTEKEVEDKGIETKEKEVKNNEMKKKETEQNNKKKITEKEVKKRKFEQSKEKETTGKKSNKKEIEQCEEKKSKEKSIKEKVYKSRKEKSSEERKVKENQIEDKLENGMKENDIHVKNEKSSEEKKVKEKEKLSEEEKVKEKETDSYKKEEVKEKEKEMKEKDIHGSSENFSKEKKVKEKEIEYYKEEEIKKKELKEKDIHISEENSNEEEKDIHRSEENSNEEEMAKENKIEYDKEEEMKEKDIHVLSEEKSNEDKKVKEKGILYDKEKEMKEIDVYVRKEKSSKETRKCVTSLEGMTSFVKKSLPNEKHIKALERSSSTKHGDKEYKKIKWKVSAIKEYEKAVICKHNIFLFAIFECHNINKTKGKRVYYIELEGTGGVHRKEILACDDQKKSDDALHRKTKSAFNIKISCHWITNSLVWAPDVDV